MGNILGPLLASCYQPCELQRPLSCSFLNNTIKLSRYVMMILIIDRTFKTFGTYTQCIELRKSPVTSTGFTAFFGHSQRKLKAKTLLTHAQKVGTFPKILGCSSMESKCFMRKTRRSLSKTSTNKI